MMTLERQQGVHSWFVIYSSFANSSFPVVVPFGVRIRLEEGVLFIRPRRDVGDEIQNLIPR